MTEVLRGSLFTVAAMSALVVACKSNTISSTSNSFLSQTIGVSGGTFSDPTNLEQITVPKGALSADVALQIGTLAEGAYPALPMGVTKQGPVFAFKPYGTSFSAPVTIAIPVPSGASGLAVYEVPTDTSGTWTVVASSPINMMGADNAAHNFLQVQTSALGVFTLGPALCVPATAYAKCVSAGNITVAQPSGGCTATAKETGDGGCGACVFTLTCDTAGCTCAESSTGRMLSPNASLMAPAACADPPSALSSMMTACSGFGG